MDIKIKEVKNRSDLRKFIYFPASLHRDHKTWTPPIYLDEWTFFNPAKNLSFATSDHVIALAYKNGVIVGRIMGIIDHRYNKIKNEQSARFNLFECINSREVAHELLNFIENWAREKGMTKLIGPFGFSDKDPQGFLVEGFDNQAVLLTAHNYPYMTDLVDSEGYEKMFDLYDYLIVTPKVLPELYNRVYSRIHGRS